MANVKFVIPEESLSSQLFTDTGRWMNEEKLENFSFSFNKSVNEIPAKLEQSYYIAGEGVSFTAEQEEKLDRVLETIKLYLSKPNMDQVKSITKYKGEDSIYSWDHDGKGIKQDLTWLTGKPTWNKPLWYETFDELLHDLYSFIVHDGYKPLRRINGYTDKRQFTI